MVRNTSTSSISNATFFEQLSLQAIEARGYQMWSLAWRGRGMKVNLNELSDQMLDKFVEWSEEQIEAENHSPQ